jgi:hypothetical protein
MWTSHENEKNTNNANPNDPMEITFERECENAKLLREEK